MTDDRWGRGGHETIGGPPAMVSPLLASTSGFDGFLQFYLFIAHHELVGRVLGSCSVHCFPDPEP